MKVKAKIRFGQVVIGQPGSGKTIYVGAMSELLRSLGRKVNLDPANENMVAFQSGSCPPDPTEL